MADASLCWYVGSLFLLVLWASLAFFWFLNMNEGATYVLWAEWMFVTIWHYLALFGTIWYLGLMIPRSVTLKLQLIPFSVFACIRSDWRHHNNISLPLWCWMHLGTLYGKSLTKYNSPCLMPCVYVTASELVSLMPNKPWSFDCVSHYVHTWMIVHTNSELHDTRLHIMLPPSPNTEQLSMALHDQTHRLDSFLHSINNLGI